jgi:hypothetical protein
MGRMSRLNDISAAFTDDTIETKELHKQIAHLK